MIYFDVKETYADEPEQNTSAHMYLEQLIAKMPWLKDILPSREQDNFSLTIVSNLYRLEIEMVI